ncbi:MAG: methyltransferase domain-containing protein, partial [Dehalococcoidia bacterium]
TLILIALAWAAVSAVAAVLVAVWMRERYGRGGPFPARDALALLNRQRRRLHPVEETVRFFRIKPGDTVLEIGPGPGYFSIEAARVAGAGGRVVCLDVQPGMIAVLDERLRQERAVNARPLVGDATRLPLADRSVDAAFFVFVLGEIPDRPAAMGELRRVMKPGGAVSVMETWTDSDYQLEASVEDLFRAYGFEPRERRRRLLGFARGFVAPG